MQGALALIALLERQLAAIAGPLGQWVESLPPQREHLDTIPGVAATAAWLVIAESGTAMRRWGSPARLAAWAGGSPGNNASAGKRRRGTRRRGKRY